MSPFREQLRGRFAVLGVVVLACLGTLLVRLWSIQVLAGAEYEALANNNRVSEITLDAPRGRILDRDGRELVTNRPSLAVSVAPSAKDDEEMLYRLSILLDKPLEEIKQRVASTREEALRPRIVSLDVPREVISYLAEHEPEFPGVEVQIVAVREYPQGSLAAHVLGYTGEISEEQVDEPEFSSYALGDIVGKAGAERQFESVLQGDKGYRRMEVDARGRPRHIIEEGQPIPGRDIVLTIDSEVQKVAERALANAIRDAHLDDYTKAKAGSAVALNVNSGEVLAMASVPTYDPTLFLGGISQENWERLNAKGSEYPLTNRAIMAQYPPASTFKGITGLAGLRYGLAREWSLYYCPGKWIEMGEQWPKWCWNRSGHKDISFHSGVVESCDTVFYEIGYEFYKQGDEKLQKFARQFGFGSPLGIDLPGEVGGRVPDAEWKAEFNTDYPEYQRWLPGDTVNIAIGQGDLLATPLQMAAAYGGIANDGKVMRSHVLKEVRDEDGKAVLTYEEEVAAEPDVTPQNLSVMRRGLRDVTEEGTAQDAFADFGATVAGKTGTAQVAGKDDYAWFVGFAPIENPKYAVAVVIEQGGHGGSVAAPAAREILASLLGLPVEHVRAVDVSR